MPDKKSIYAVIGASSDTAKYGHRVYKDLLAGGFKVYPVNPNLKSLLGNEVYSTFSDIPEHIDTAVFVVPPAVTIKILPEVKSLGIENVWFQPGSESPDAIAFCEANSINCIHDACIMIERKKNG